MQIIVDFAGLNLAGLSSSGPILCDYRTHVSLTHIRFNKAI